MSKNVVGTMVVCLGCKRMVWAYDSDYGDLRGVLNMMQMPCRLCGDRGNFDGYRVEPHSVPEFEHDPWGAMHAVAKQEGFEWANSENCTWFPTYWRGAQGGIIPSSTQEGKGEA